MEKFKAKVVVPAKQRGKIAPTRMSHVVLNTRPENYETMVSWYRTVFEAELAYANNEVAFLGFDEEHHRIAIAAVPHVVEPRPRSWGLNHFAFTYESLEDLLATYERLKDEDIRPYWPILHGPTTSLYYKDPDLNRVELLCDNMDEQELLEFFESGAFDENFMGIIFDPEEMHARLKAGVPKKELTRRELLPQGVSPWDMYRE